MRASMKIVLFINLILLNARRTLHKNENKQRGALFASKEKPMHFSGTPPFAN